MAGIHGRENEGSYSIVLSGGYEDDEDEGEEFTYSGSGGRDLSGNKRTAKQSYDQKLTHMNRYYCEGGEGRCALCDVRGEGMGEGMCAQCEGVLGEEVLS